MPFDLTISGTTFATFVLASLVLAVTPGPAVVYILTRTVTQGRPAGLASVGGVALGNLGNAIGASLGLAALLAVSAVAFTVLKFAGAAYLVWLGIQALRSSGPRADAAEVPRDAVRRIFRDGFFVALLNPKTAIFFAAFLPQFIDPTHSALGQSVLFGALFVAVAGTTDTLWVLAASVAAPLLSRQQGAKRVGRYTSAGVYFGLGLFTALGGPRKGA
jgi:threonine/homoserine/homoserine lactone efflux protein